MKSLDFEIRDSNSNEKNMTMDRIRNHMFKTDKTEMFYLRQNIVRNWKFPVFSLIKIN